MSIKGLCAFGERSIGPVFRKLEIDSLGFS